MILITSEITKKTKENKNVSIVSLIFDVCEFFFDVCEHEFQIRLKWCSKKCNFIFDVCDFYF